MGNSPSNLKFEKRDADLWYWIVTDHQGNVLDQSPFGFHDRSVCSEHALRRGYALP